MSSVQALTAAAGRHEPLFRGGRRALWPGIAAGERRRPAASSNTGEEDIAPSLPEQIVDGTALPPQPWRRSRHAATPHARRDRRAPNRPSSPEQLNAGAKGHRAAAPRPSSHHATRLVLVPSISELKAPRHSSNAW
jgi:hypothetical protein